MTAFRGGTTMHQQIRTAPKTSAADIEKLLGRLTDAGVDLAAAGGGDLEFGGVFALAAKHEWHDAAIKVLDKFKYKYEVIGPSDPDGPKDPRLTLCWMEDRSGELHRCIQGVAEENLKSGRIIRDLIIGAPEGGRVPVQIYSEEVRTPQTVDSGTGS
jgi:hypothetical protein